MLLQQSMALQVTLQLRIDLFSVGVNCLEDLR
jgi:hypothetical protein